MWKITRCLVVVAVAVLTLTGCAQQSPKDAFLSAVRVADPDTVDVPDDLLIGQGNMVCDDVAKHGLSSVIDTLSRIYASGDTVSGNKLTIVLTEATTHLCPKPGASPTTS